MSKKGIQWAFYTLFRIFFRILFTFCFPLEVRGKKHFKQSKPVILAGNHSGLLDTPILVHLLGQKMFFFMHDSVHKWPVIGKLVRFAQIIVLKPGNEIASIRESIQRIKSGYSLCIFPEGKLSENGELQDFQPGTAMIQKQSNAPILPFYIHGGYESWSWKKRLSPQFGKLIIQFGAPIMLNKNRKQGNQELKEAVEKLKKEIEGEENIRKARS